MVRQPWVPARDTERIAAYTSANPHVSQSDPKVRRPEAGALLDGDRRVAGAVVALGPGRLSGLDVGLRPAAGISLVAGGRFRENGSCRER